MASLSLDDVPNRIDRQYFKGVVRGVHNGSAQDIRTYANGNGSDGEWFFDVVIMIAVIIGDIL